MPSIYLELTSPAFPSPSCYTRLPSPDTKKASSNRSPDQRPLSPRYPLLQLAVLPWLNWEPARNHCLPAVVWRRILAPHTDCNVNRFSLRRRTRPCVSCFAFIRLVSGLLTPEKLTSCHRDSLLRLSFASRAPAQIRPSALRSTSELTLERNRHHKSLRSAQIVSLFSQCRAKAESAPLGRSRTTSSSK